MSRAVFNIVEAGPLVTIQDRGRPGLMRIGVTGSGPMDRAAFAMVNAALGNDPGAAGIEVSVAGLVLECVEGDVTLAIAGGGFRVIIDGEEHPSWLVTTMRPGMRIAVRPGFWGSWTYLGFAGRLEARPWLGSVSTHGLTGLGGGKLVAGGQIVIGDAETREDRAGPLPRPAAARPPERVRVVLGPQDRYFAPETIARFLSEPFTLTSAYDRMGVRLAGPSLAPAAALDMPSEAIARGSVQVSGDGTATVLLADHQSTGGYPKIATLPADQVDVFAQLRSRARVRFAAISPATAIAEARTRHIAATRFLEALRRAGGRLPPPA